jgi:hypothetical protein
LGLDRLAVGREATRSKGRRIQRGWGGGKKSEEVVKGRNTFEKLE